VTVVSVQLASAQFSPRVLRGFLRDRFSQHVIGLVVGTFTYCLLVLTTVHGSTPGLDAAAPSLAVTIGVVLGVVAVIAIVAFIDHSARHMQVGEIIRRVTDESCQLITNRLARPEDDAPAHVEHEEGYGLGRLDELPAGRALVCPSSGWVQQVAVQKLLDDLPPGGALRLDLRPGDHVVRGMVVGTAWSDAAVLPNLSSALVIGPRRTMQQDLSFGTRQLVDIGLRALSPGINDPTTAVEVLGALTVVLSTLADRALPGRVLVGKDGRRLYRPRELGWTDHVQLAYDELRVAAVSQPAVLIELCRQLQALAGLTPAGGSNRTPLETQAQLVIDGLRQSGHVQADADRVCAAAERLIADNP